MKRLLLFAVAVFALTVPASSQAGPGVLFCPYLVAWNGADFVENDMCVSVSDSFIAAGGAVNIYEQGQYASPLVGAYVVRTGQKKACVVATLWTNGGQQLPPGVGGTHCVLF